MATYYVNAATGSEANDGLSAATPWLLIPGQTGAHAVTAGSVIRIRTGLDYSAGGRLFPPQNNLTYEGYGLAANVLVLDKLPLGSRRVVRTPGVDEGMWILTNAPYAANLQGMVSTLARSGTVIADMYCDVFDGALAGATSTGVVFGSSTSSYSGATLKRSWVRNAGYAVSGFTNSIAIDECRIERTAADAILYSGAAGTSFRAGGVDRITNTEIIDPGWDDVWAIGDGFQTTSTYAANLQLANIYMRKPSTAKQGMVVCDATGGVEISDVLIDGEGVGQGHINFTNILGSIRVNRLTLRDALATNGNPAIRVLSDPGTATVMGTGSRIDIDGLRIEGAACERIFGWNSSIIAGSTVDGVVSMRNVYAEGVGSQTPDSKSALFSLVETAQITVGANAQFHASGITLNVTPNVPIVRFPTGSAADARYTFRNSRLPAGEYYIGSTQYADLAAFTAAKTGAQTNVIFDAAHSGGDPKGAPVSGSPIYRVGTIIGSGLERDITGVYRWIPPSIGATEAVDARPLRTLP